MSEHVESQSLAIPTSAGLAFDPERPTVLIQRALALLDGSEGYLPPPELPPGGMEKLVAHFAMRLGVSLLTVAESVKVQRPVTFTPEQSALAHCCLYVCAHAPSPVTPFGMTRLGAVTDLVADERRFWWWDALTLQVALNAGGEGNGGVRALYGNLAHPHDEIRQQVLQTAWFARSCLGAREASLALLQSVEIHSAHWPTSLAVLRAISGDQDRFRELIGAYKPRQHPRRFRGRISALNERNGSLVSYIERPGDLLALERDIRRRVESRIVGV